MTLEELLKIAEGAYKEQGFDLPGTGDGLYIFIMQELTETFEAHETEEQQLKDALDVMELAKADVDAVCEAIYKKLLGLRGA
jgi:hypothetical protein